jgi:hypothetical protein
MDCFSCVMGESGGVSLLGFSKVLTLLRVLKTRGERVYFLLPCQIVTSLI